MRKKLHVEDWRWLHAANLRYTLGSLATVSEELHKFAAITAIEIALGRAQGRHKPGPSAAGHALTLACRTLTLVADRQADLLQLAEYALNATSGQGHGACFRRGADNKNSPIPSTLDNRQTCHKAVRPC